MTPTVEEYDAALKLIKDHKICDGCKQMFKTEDTTRTLK